MITEKDLDRTSTKEEFDRAIEIWKYKKEKYGFMLPNSGIVVFKSKSDFTRLFNAMFHRAIYWECDKDEETGSVCIPWFQEYYELENMFDMKFKFYHEYDEIREDGKECFIQKYDPDELNLDGENEFIRYYNAVGVKEQPVFNDDCWEFNENKKYPMIAYVFFEQGWCNSLKIFIDDNLEDVLNRKYY